MTTAFYQYVVSPSEESAAKLAHYRVGLRPPLPTLPENVFYPGTNVVSWMSQQAVSFLVRFQVSIPRYCVPAVMRSRHRPLSTLVSLPLLLGLEVCGSALGL